jgi:hypothetical protein
MPNRPDNDRLRPRQVMGHEADGRRRRCLLDDRRRRCNALFRRRARLEGGTPEIPGGHARRYEQAKPQRIE